MHHLELPLYAILLATLSRMVLGALWYSPVLFLNPWMRMTGITRDQMREGFGGKIAGDIVGSFLMAGAMAHMVLWAGATEVLGGLLVGFICWLGFVAVATISTVTYEKRPFGVWVIHNSYNLVSLLAKGLIIALWK